MMGDQSAIEWTEATWNCLIGCTRVSAGCQACYAERLVHRGLSPQHRGLTRIVNGTPHWTGAVRLVESALDLPLRWRKPRRIFVNSLSDLFHEAVPDEWIDRIFRTMLSAPQHVYQVLTKRPARMLEYLKDQGLGWPWPFVWLGVSVEDQTTADERIPVLLQTPAAVRWVSYEPALGPVTFHPLADRMYRMFSRWYGPDGQFDPTGSQPEKERMEAYFPRVDWIVVGGESGPGARPFDLAWARQTIAQGLAAGVPVFVKQLGALPYEHNGDWPLLYRDAPPARYFSDYDGSDVFYADDLIRDHKGGNPLEWPEDLRVREFPR